MKALIVLLALKGFLTLAAIYHRNQAGQSPPAEAEKLFAQGVKWAGKREWTKAIAAYDQALELNPLYAEAFLKRGLAYLQKEKYDRVISDFNRAIALRPNLVDAYVLRGLAYCEQKRYCLAEADFLKVNELNRKVYASIYAAVSTEFPQVKLPQPRKRILAKETAVYHVVSPISC